MTMVGFPADKMETKHPNDEHEQSSKQWTWKTIIQTMNMKQQSSKQWTWKNNHPNNEHEKTIIQTMNMKRQSSTKWTWKNNHQYWDAVRNDNFALWVHIKHTPKKPISLSTV
jgi:hypothetical protein